MKNYFRGFLDIFSFTFKQHSKTPSYRTSTIIIAILCLILPATVMIGIETFSEEPSKEPDYKDANGVYEEYIPVDMTPLKEVYLVDISDEKLVDFTGLEIAVEHGFATDITVIDCGSNFDKAQKATKNNNNALVMVTEQKGKDYTTNILIPEGSDISEDVAQQFDVVAMAYADSFAVAHDVPQTYGTIITEDTPTTEEEIEAIQAEEAKKLVNMIVMYVNIMLLYFFVLIYGQGVANSVVMEKSSKLMESMLISVNPVAIILGKLFAITATGVVQLVSWLVSLGISFAVGTYVVKEINPETTMGIIEMFELLKDITDGMFSPLNCILAVTLIVIGMLLYCSLAGIGGAMASKAEDLSSANVIFTLVLVISFLAVIYGGGMDGTASPIFDWIPFTAVMVTPAKVLLGEMVLWKTLAIAGIIFVSAIVATLVAGKVYKNLVFYRGDALNPASLVAILKKTK